MNILGIKELQTNPSKLSHSMANNELLMVTKRGLPIGITVPFSQELVENGLSTWLSIKAYQNASLSLGQLAKSLNKNKPETITLLDSLNISVIDYDLNDDLKSLDRIF